MSSSGKRKPKFRKVPAFNLDDALSLYRCAFYSAMGVRNNETKPTDSECVRWLTKVREHAEKLQSFNQLPALGNLPHWRFWIEPPDSSKAKEAGQ